MAPVFCSVKDMVADQRDVGERKEMAEFGLSCGRLPPNAAGEGSVCFVLPLFCLQTRIVSDCLLTMIFITFYSINLVHFFMESLK